MYLKNSWYVAAWSRELTDTPMARTLLDQPVVMYRAANGRAAALEDRCCHRHLPLSMGAVVGDDLQCGYHGLKFDVSGACVEVPGQSQVPPGAWVKSFPLAEKYHWVWIWMGDPEKADEALIPDWWQADHPDWASARPGPLYLKANYRLIGDNVLDVTHVNYVHGSTIGSLSTHEFPVETEREDGLVRMSRWTYDRPPPPMYQKAGNFAGNVDRWQIVEHIPPCFSANEAGCAEVGKGHEEREQAGRMKLIAFSAPTPETETTTHYFFSFVRSFGHDDPELDVMFHDGLTNLFHEDVVVLEAQQAMMNRKPGASQIDINVDAAPLAARKMLDDMIAAERSA